MTPDEAAAHIEKYTTKLPALKRFKFRIHSLLDGLIFDKDLKVASIESRVKGVGSFSEKITRLGKDYIDPIAEITDLVGLRVVVYQLSDIDRVGEIIRSNFQIDEDHSINKSEDLEVDRFGYLSVHYVFSLDESRAKLPEYSGLRNIRGEIQIRTVLQHAWAAIDHKLRYKSDKDIPTKHKRHLYRISALLEAADESFEILTSDLAESIGEYKESVKGGNLKLPLDLDSITTYFNEAPIPLALVKTAENAHIVVAPHSPNSKQQEFSRLLKHATEDLGAKDIESLNKLVESAIPSAKAFFETLEKEWRKAIADKQVKLVLPKEMIFLSVFYLASYRNKLPTENLPQLGRLSKAFTSALAEAAKEQK